MGTGTGTGTEASTVAEMGTGTTMTGKGTRIGSGRAEGGRKSARNRKIVVDAVREKGETRVKREKNVEKKGFRKNLNASKPSNYHTKGLGGNNGCRDKNCTWY